MPAPKKILADRSGLDGVVEISVVHEHLIGTFFDFHDAHLYPCAMTVQSRSPFCIIAVFEDNIAP